MLRRGICVSLLMIPWILSAQAVSTQKGDTTLIVTKGNGRWEAPRWAVETARIGKGAGSTDLLGNVVAHATLPDGGVVLFDRNSDDGQPRLKLFDSAGRFVRNIARVGAGPGEYRDIQSLLVTDDNRIVVSDPSNARLNTYSGGGNFLWQVRVPDVGSFVHQLFSGPGHGIFVARNNPIPRAKSLMLSREFLQVDSARGVVQVVPAVVPPPPFTAGGMFNGILRDGAVVWIGGYPAQVNILESAGGRGVIVSTLPLPQIKNPPRKTAPQTDSKPANAAAKSLLSIQYLPYSPPFLAASLTVEAGSRIWIRRNMPFIKHTEATAGKLRGATYSEVVYAVFERDGTYLGEAHFPGLRFAADISVRGGTAWIRSTEEDRTQILIRYRLK